MYSFVLRSDPAFCSSVPHMDTQDLLKHFTSLCSPTPPQLVG